MSRTNSSWANWGRRLDRVLAATALGAVRLYQWVLSPLKITFFGAASSCRFHPTCSQYACDCFRQHTFFKALVLTLKRLAKCHPFHPGGSDPVPPS